MVESILLVLLAFAILALLAGVLGILAAGVFLADPFGRTVGGVPWFVFLLTIVIGIKVAAGTALICLTLFRED